MRGQVGQNRDKDKSAERAIKQEGMGEREWRACLVCVNDLRVEERDELVEFQREQVFLVPLQQREREAKDGLDARREAVVEYAVHNLEREAARVREGVGARGERKAVSVGLRCASGGSAAHRYENSVRNHCEQNMLDLTPWRTKCRYRTGSSSSMSRSNWARLRRVSHRACGKREAPGTNTERRTLAGSVCRAGR
jgi:hypothetical protein